MLDMREVPQTKLLRPEKQLEIYHYASQLYDFRDAILAFWKEELRGFMPDF